MSSKSEYVDLFRSTVKSRRSNLRIDNERDVDPALAVELCELGTWAPNHRRTEPWRFSIFAGDGRYELGAAVALAMRASGDERARVAKARVKYLRSPIVIAVSAIAGSSDTETIENQYAVAACVQTMLLASETMGLATFWGSSPEPTNPRLLETLKFDTSSRIIALIYVGYPIADAPPVARQPAKITVFDTSPTGESGSLPSNVTQSDD